MPTLAPAEYPRDAAAVCGLFREYAAWLAIDLSFQDFENELANLPGRYAAPAGRLLLAWPGEAGAGEPLGCVALRPIGEGACEMKRLYLRPAARGAGLGRVMAERICAEARALGYRSICLDTLPRMAAAVHLYTDLGFREIAPYTYNPVPGTLFLALGLAPRPPEAD
ncbi:MAG TPA: GNAT family N-acetyltransferase [Burkholderiales bacterium]|jgi:GNAT superfamily N-acetyltransferase